jgi:hypothetical protein
MTDLLESLNLHNARPEAASNKKRTVPIKTQKKRNLFLLESDIQPSLLMKASTPPSPAASPPVRKPG